MTKHDLRREKREFWGDLANAQHPEFFLTVTLKRCYADSVAIDAFSFAMRAIQRRIPSNRVLRGLASLERTWKSAAFENQLHLHAVLWGVVGNVREPEAFMTDLVNGVFMKLRDSQRRKMTRIKNIHLQYVYSDGGAEYTVKDVGKEERRRCRVWTITPKGFDTSTDYFN